VCSSLAAIQAQRTRGEHAREQQQRALQNVYRETVEQKARCDSLVSLCASLQRDQDALKVQAAAAAAPLPVSVLPAAAMPPPFASYTASNPASAVPIGMPYVALPPSQYIYPSFVSPTLAATAARSFAMAPPAAAPLTNKERLEAQLADLLAQQKAMAQQKR
jgi:hypothetical protein